MGSTYHLNPNQISIGQLFDTFVEGNLSPGRVILLERKDQRRATLESLGIATLADLIDRGKTPQRLAQLADETAIDPEYLTILLRQARSYLPAAVPLDRFDGVPDDIVDALAARGIRTTKHLFEAQVQYSSAAEFAAALGTSADAMARLIALADLVRITGVGPVFARLFVDLGVEGLHDLAGRDAAALLVQLEERAGTLGYRGPSATLWDVEQCIMTARRLTASPG